MVGAGPGPAGANGAGTRDMGDAAAGFHYTQLVVGGQEHAGVMDATANLAEGTPSTWSLYVGVADVDATIAQATGLGATVVQAAETGATRDHRDRDVRAAPTAAASHSRGSRRVAMADPVIARSATCGLRGGPWCRCPGDHDAGRRR